VQCLIRALQTFRKQSEFAKDAIPKKSAKSTIPPCLHLN